MKTWSLNKTFELNGDGYRTDAETLKVLNSVMPTAKKTGNSTAVQAILFLGLKAGRIEQLSA